MIASGSNSHRGNDEKVQPTLFSKLLNKSSPNFQELNISTLLPSTKYKSSKVSSPLILKKDFKEIFISAHVVPNHNTYRIDPVNIDQLSSTQRSSQIETVKNQNICPESSYCGTLQSWKKIKSNQNINNFISQKKQQLEIIQRNSRDTLGTETKFSRPFKPRINIPQFEKGEKLSSRKLDSISNEPKDKNKEILRRRLKKSAFPAFLVKQKTKKETIKSLNVRKYLEVLEEEEQIKISQLKRDKETKRQKVVNTFATSNFNLFKPTTIQNKLSEKNWP